MNDDLAERVSNSLVIADFNGVVAVSRFWRTFAMHYPIGLKDISNFFRFASTRFLELNNGYNLDSDEILRKKVSFIKGMSHHEVLKLLKYKFSLEVNQEFVNIVNRLRESLGMSEITVPVITRDGDYVHYWFSGYKRKLLGDNTPEKFFECYNINLRIISNSYETDEIGVYTGRVFPSEEGRILFPDNPLITSEKSGKYSIGKKRRIVLVDAEEARYMERKGYERDLLFLIDVDDKKRLDERIGEAKEFIQRKFKISN